LTLPKPWESKGALFGSDRQIGAPEEGNCEACPEDPNIDARFLEILPSHAARVKAAEETALHADQPPGGGRDQCAPVGQRKAAPLYRTRLDGFAGDEEGYELFERPHETRLAGDFLCDFCGYAHGLSYQ
jgi:hypothetical protein